MLVHRVLAAPALAAQQKNESLGCCLKLCGLHAQVFAQSAQSAHGDSRMGRDTSNPTALCRERSWGALVHSSVCTCRGPAM